jgi:hypothetical protein
MEAEQRDAVQLLPNELLLPVYDRLDECGAKRTLVNLMLADRNSFEVGIGVHFRHIAISGSWGAERISNFCDEYREFFKHVRRLDVVGTWDGESRLDTKSEAALKRVFKLAFPHVRHVALTPQHKKVLLAAFAAFENASEALERVDLVLDDWSSRFFTSAYGFPQSVKRVDLTINSDCDANHILAMLRQRAPGLEEWNLRSPYSPDTMESLFYDRRLITTLKDVVLSFDIGVCWNTQALFNFVEYPGFDLRNFRLTGIASVGINTLFSRMKKVESITLDGDYRTSRLLSDLLEMPKTVSRLEILDPRPSQPGTIEQLKRIVDHCDWIQFIVLHETDGFMNWEGAEEERAFWMSMSPRVVWTKQIRARHEA